MPISFRRSVSARASLFVPALLLCSLSFTASQAIGQEAAPQTHLQRFMEQFDLGLSAEGNIGTTVSGIEHRDANTTKNVLTIKPSTTVGELLTVRYTRKPWMGFEFNYSNARYVQNYTFTPQLNILAGGAQTGVHEISFGYVAHPAHKFAGIQPFLGGGIGTISFKPTRYGGQGLPYQYRALYYYDLGGEANFPNSHFGMRAAFREQFYMAPDFLQNYLTILKHTHTIQPTVGFFVRF